MEVDEHKVTATEVYVWGQTGNYQLGIDPDVNGYVVEPTPVSAYNGSVILDVALGTKHSLILTSVGLISEGCNSHGQLGRQPGEDCTIGRPELVDGLPREDIAAIAVGDTHSMALTKRGSLYSWGANDYGQLGRSIIDAHTHLVGEVKFPVGCKITQIACGEYHNIALAYDGALYSWGSNQCGQLGHGTTGPFLSQPEAIASVSSLHFVKIAAGGSHSFALTISNAPFGWGKNSNGQLGLGNNDDKSFPVCCRALRQQRIKHISCGLNHTAALTKDGGVFTFGAGQHGQLGHGLSQDEYLPKKVLEHMGSTITQLSTGRYHTLTLVPSSGRIYSFGLGSNGQLGVGNTDKKTCPSRVKPAWTEKSGSSMDCVRRIFAGGDGNVVVIGDKSAVQLDERDVMPTQAMLDASLIESLVNGQTVPTGGLRKLDPQLECNINAVFGRCSAWNGAFLAKEDEQACGSTHHGVDIDLAKEQLARTANSSNELVRNLLATNLERNLMPSLKRKIPDVEALRVFLILPFLPLFSDPSNFDTLHGHYANALVSLDNPASKVLDKWLLRVPLRHFRFYLLTFKKVVSYILLLSNPSTEHQAFVRLEAVQTCLSVMRKLYCVNEAEDKEQKLPYFDFYVPEIATRVDIAEDYRNWINKSPTDKNGQRIVSFCNYLFAFDAHAKTTLLHTDAIFQMQRAIEDAHRLNLFNIFSSQQHIDTVHPCLVIDVSRENIVIDTLRSLNNHGSADLKKPLKVKFKGEEAVDEGGVRKEFFILLIREVLDIKYGMFQHHEESRLLWFNSSTFEEDMAMFHLIGLLCGLAIYNITIIDLPFPLALYKKLLNKSVNLDDLRELDPRLGKSLQDLLDYDGDDVADTFCLTFSVNLNILDQVVERDLVPDGRHLPVTNDNRQEYVNRYVSFIFNESVEKMFKAFYDGFHKVCGSIVLDHFHPMELQAMVVGNEQYDWNELEENCEYKGEFFRKHETVEMFWQVFYGLSESQQKQFLRFLTGCDRIPIQGTKSLKMAMQPMRTSDDYLPVAHTCFNLLDLPVKYSSKEKLREKLLGAIENAEGFGLV